MTDLEDRLFRLLADRYRGEGLLGSGGMAFVYRAHDRRHDRKVAVKVLRPELAAVVGADRFLQEIRVTANLQHPHILPLYDSGTVEGIVYYVMPYVAGESLRARLERERQLPVGETFELIRAVAGALDYAHRQGVVHRDIKPENILLHDGQPMVADFGIALAVTAAAGARITQTGVSVGTPQYMSPEQASGEHTDGRTDVYALGCLAYEMLTGVPPHQGPNAQAILAAALTTDPRPVHELRRSVPPSASVAIHRALERLPADRFGTALEFTGAMTDPASPRSPSKAGWYWPVGVAAAAIAGILIGKTWSKVGERPEPTRRWSLVLPERAPIALTGPGPLGIWQSALAIDSAGTTLVYAGPDGATTRLFLRPLDRDSVVAIPGTEGAYHPLFSREGAWIAFFSGNELRKIPVSGTGSVTLTKVDRPSGAVWASPDRILVLENEGFTMRLVSASGGGADSTIALSTQFGTPDMLPGGQWAVGQLSSGQLAILSLADGRLMGVTRDGVVPIDSVRQANMLLGASPKWWAPTKHLVFGTGDGVVSAMPFDGERRQVLGPPVPVLTGVRIEEGFGFGEYAIGGAGTFVFVPGASQSWGRIALLSPTGQLDTLPFPRGPYTQLRLSPDGRRLAVQTRAEVGGWEVVVLDIETGQRQRIPIGGEFRTFPASWTPDGQELLIGLWDPAQFINYGAQFYSLREGAKELVPLRGVSYMSIGPTGNDLVFSDWRTGEISIRPLTGDTTARVRVPGRGFAASFAPNAKWLAWGDLEGGISVSALPPTGAARSVAERGQQPLWSPKGDRLIYRDGRRFFEIKVSPSGDLRPGPPTLIAEGPFVRIFAWNHSMAPDGRIVVVVALPEGTRRDLSVVTGFGQQLTRLAPPTRQ